MEGAPQPPKRVGKIFDQAPILEEFERGRGFTEKAALMFNVPSQSWTFIWSRERQDLTSGTSQISDGSRL